MGDSVSWERISYTSQVPIAPRQCHSTVSYQDKLFIFGGCFQYNPSRKVRECTNQVLEFDLNTGTIEVVKAKGISIGSRKNHTAAAYKGSMVVYGGQTENGMLTQDLIVFHMDSPEWVKLSFKPGSIIMQPVV